MSYVEAVEPAQADGPLRTLYAEIAATWEGDVPALMQALGIAPGALRTVYDQARAIAFGGSSLGRRREELIGTLVAQQYGCEALLLAHGEWLRQATGDDALVYHMQRDHSRAALDPTERALVDYVARLSLTPGGMGEDDLQPLRAVGFDDRGLLDIVMLTALGNFMVRVVGGLGVAPDETLRRTRAEAERRLGDPTKEGTA